MQGPPLSYAGDDFIKSDLKRLKKWRSASEDIKSQCDIVSGALNELPPLFNFCGGLITKIEIEDEVFYCYKDRVPITDPKMSPSEGGRILFAIATKSKAFIPLVFYAAKEEGTMYSINSKQFKLTSTNLGKIINEKLS